MSDVTTDTMMHSVAAGIAVDIAEEGFDRVSAILSGIPGGANRAVGSALARAAAAGKTVAKRAVTQEYAISSSEFTNRTKNVNNIQRECLTVMVFVLQDIISLTMVILFFLQRLVHFQSQRAELS